MTPRAIRAGFSGLTIEHVDGARDHVAWRKFRDDLRQLRRRPDIRAMYPNGLQLGALQSRLDDALLARLASRSPWNALRRGDDVLQIPSPPAWRVAAYFAFPVICVVLACLLMIHGKADVSLQALREARAAPNEATILLLVILMTAMAFFTLMVIMSFTITREWRDFRRRRPALSTYGADARGVTLVYRSGAEEKFAWSELRMVRGHSLVFGADPRYVVTLPFPIGIEPALPLLRALRARFRDRACEQRARRRARAAMIRCACYFVIAGAAAVRMGPSLAGGGVCAVARPEITPATISAAIHGRKDQRFCLAEPRWTASGSRRVADEWREASDVRGWVAIERPCVRNERRCDMWAPCQR